MRGIIRYSTYLPHWRLDREEIAKFFGQGGGRGTRSVAGHDEDTTTMAVEALRPVVGVDQDDEISRVYFSTCSPAYLDKTNASTIHGALGLDSRVGAYDLGGATRSSTASLLAGFESTGNCLVCMSEIRGGLPTSPDETQGGDGACGFLIGNESANRDVLAELIGSFSTTEEFLDRWREPTSELSKTWEERFGEYRYLDLGVSGFNGACEKFGIVPGDIGQLVISGTHTRASIALGKKLGIPLGSIQSELSEKVGNMAGAHSGLLLAGAIEGAGPGEIIALIVLADGVDVMFFRTTEAVKSWHQPETLGDQISKYDLVPYSKFLSWRGMVTVEPPRRPEPARTSSSAAWRSRRWKFGLEASRDPVTETVYMPPSRVSMERDSVDQMDVAAKSASKGTVVTYTVDRLAYSPSPPIVFAIIDFDDGGRFPVEMTDCSPDQVDIGKRVEMTFRKLAVSEGIRNYFWKARLID